MSNPTTLLIPPKKEEYLIAAMLLCCVAIVDFIGFVLLGLSVQNSPVLWVALVMLVLAAVKK